ncbi:MAG: hypothetical protein KA321_09275, partial [Pseudomonadales bacterium]|nr:hypothetical protein [Pseudomonadales bacterium]
PKVTFISAGMPKRNGARGAVRVADISLLPGPQMSVQVGIHADWCLRGGGGFGFAEPLSG